MIVRTDVFKEICTKILAAVDTSVNTPITGTIALTAKEGLFCVVCTNMRYYVEVRTEVDIESQFEAAINAGAFLKLISQVTTEVVEMSLKDTYLLVKANGTYKFPLVYDGENLLRLPTIEVGDVVCRVEVPTSALSSMLTYNMKELNKSKGQVQNTAQRMFYLDQHGCITHTATGACINTFELSEPFKILIPQQVVKLFKLFKDDNVALTVGEAQVTADITQVRIKLETPSVTLSAALPFDSRMLDEVPAEILRSKAAAAYPYFATFEKSDFVAAINRLLAVSHTELSFGSYGELLFSPTELTLLDVREDNTDKVFYTGEVQLDQDYSAVVDLEDLKLTLEACSEQYVTLYFGDSKAIVVSRAGVKNLIPEARVIE